MLFKKMSVVINRHGFICIMQNCVTTCVSLTSHFVHAFEQILDQDGGECGRGGGVGEEAVGHNLKRVILVDSLDHVLQTTK